LHILRELRPTHARTSSSCSATARFAWLLTIPSSKIRRSPRSCRSCRLVAAIPSRAPPPQARALACAHDRTALEAETAVKQRATVEPLRVALGGTYVPTQAGPKPQRHVAKSPPSTSRGYTRTASMHHATTFGCRAFRCARKSARRSTSIPARFTACARSTAGAPCASRCRSHAACVISSPVRLQRSHRRAGHRRSGNRLHLHRRLGCRAAGRFGRCRIAEEFGAERTRRLRILLEVRRQQADHVGRALPVRRSDVVLELYPVADSLLVFSATGVASDGTGTRSRVQHTHPDDAGRPKAARAMTA